jgi:acylphosphatase
VTDDGLVRRGYRVTGRVQGVYYRAWARGVANEMGLRGTVRNRMDGSVEVHAAGSRGIVTDFEEVLWDGPAQAEVKRVESIESPDRLPEGPFQILPTV